MSKIKYFYSGVFYVHPPLYSTYRQARRDSPMKEAYITVTGTHFRYGTEMVEKGDILYLKKDTNNEYDNESIQVNHIPFGKIGYVANSVRTVIGECMSAGRLYDKIGQTAEAVVTFKSQDFIICKVVLDPSFSEVQVYQQDACNEK